MITKESLLKDIGRHLDSLSYFGEDERVDLINKILTEVNRHLPIKGHPVSKIQWVKSDLVNPNDYNPNKVAAPEMRLLKRSIRRDGYTQPVVVAKDGDQYVVVDGFHRSQLGREDREIRDSVKGYLPVAVIKTERGSRQDRVAATIRHNRARGEHGIRPMTEIVDELGALGMDAAQVSKELGMEADEVLRFIQVKGGGIPDQFKDGNWSKAWSPLDQIIRPIDGVDHEVTIEIHPGVLVAFHTYNEEANEILKRTMRWDGDHKVWSRFLAEIHMPHEDRAAELAHELLQAGFTVRCAGPGWETWREKAARQDYENFHPRWIMAVRESPEELKFKFGLTHFIGEKEDRLLKSRVRKFPKLDHQAYRRSCRVVDLDKVGELEEIANIHGFRWTLAAKALADIAKLQLEGLTVEPSSYEPMVFDESGIDSTYEYPSDLED